MCKINQQNLEQQQKSFFDNGRKRIEGKPLNWVIGKSVESYVEDSLNKNLPKVKAKF